MWVSSPFGVGLGSDVNKFAMPGAAARDIQASGRIQTDGVFSEKFGEAPSISSSFMEPRIITDRAFRRLELPDHKHLTPAGIENPMSPTRPAFRSGTPRWKAHKKYNTGESRLKFISYRPFILTKRCQRNRSMSQAFKPRFSPWQLDPEAIERLSLRSELTSLNVCSCRQALPMEQLPFQCRPLPHHPIPEGSVTVVQRMKCRISMPGNEPSESAIIVTTRSWRKRWSLL